MQRELVLDIERPFAEALARALEAIIEEARRQAGRAIDEPADAVHQYRRALRRAEAVLDLSWPMMRKEPRRWLERSLGRARRRTRIARDLDAVMPMVDKIAALDLFEAEDGSLAALRAWLEGCRAELASDEIVAWRLRKNARALAGLADIFQAAIHTWVDHELAIDRLRESYREARQTWKTAVASGKAKDVHALRRAARKLRYQLELLASARPSKVDAAPAGGESASAGQGAVAAATDGAAAAATDGAAAAATDGAAAAATDGAVAAATDGAAAAAPLSDAGRARAEPAWLAPVAALHDVVKGLVKELGAVTDLMALRAIVDEADRDSSEFDAERLVAILGELLEGRIERALGEAEKAFAVPAKRLFIAEPEASAAGDAATAEQGAASEGGAAHVEPVAAPPATPGEGHAEKSA